MLKNNIRALYAICASLLIMLFAHPLHATPFVYVANDNDTFVTAIDAATNSQVATTDLSVSPNYNGLAITPDGKTVYVACTDNTVKSIDVPTNTIILPDISVSATPHSIAITPDGAYAYVTCDDGTVNRINIALNTVDNTITGFSDPYDIAITPNGLTAYVSDQGAREIVPINLADDSLGYALPLVQDIPTGIAITPDSAYAYVANPQIERSRGLPSGYVLQLDLSDPVVPILSYTFDLGTNSLPQGLAITSDGNTLYITDNFFNTVIPIDISNPASPVQHASASVGSKPWIIAITPDGKSAYISNSGASTPPSLTELDITTPLAPTVITTSIGIRGPGSVYAAGLAISSFVPPVPVTIFPPTSVSGCKMKNVFLLQTDFINNITWTAPEYGDAPNAYNIYRDPALTELVATVPASDTLQYYDHNRKPNVIYSYYITSIDDYGNQSTAASVTVTNQC